MTRKLNATFGKLCNGCPLRAVCTTAKAGRKLVVNPYDPELRAARAAAQDSAFQADYLRWRPMVERSLSWIVANNNRRLRYRGVARNHQWLATRAAAINLRRLLALGLDHNGQTWVIA